MNFPDLQVEKIFQKFVETYIHNNDKPRSANEIFSNVAIAQLDRTSVS